MRFILALSILFNVTHSYALPVNDIFKAFATAVVAMTVIATENKSHGATDFNTSYPISNQLSKEFISFQEDLSKCERHLKMTSETLNKVLNNKQYYKDLRKNKKAQRNKRKQR